VNPRYETTFVFDNDFPALLPPDLDDARTSSASDALFVAEPDRGLCRVLCFSPRHDVTLAQMSTPAIRSVVDLWAAQTEELGALPFINHVEIFENRGALMGASNPHPHGQIWAEERLPVDIAAELTHQRAWLAERQQCLLCEVVARELSDGARVVVENEGFIAIVPFWAVWPYEMLLLPRAHCASIPALQSEQRDQLADIVRRIARLYDRVFEAPMPQSWGFHQEPVDDHDHPEWHLHAHFYPPLLRSASVRKWMVGYELLAQPQRDLTPEAAAERLRACAENP
jgi:UDPglucose--hexose-1-phosphate uridylyltransferase